MANAIDVRPRSAPARALHWATALLVLSAWVVGSTMDDFARGAPRELARELHYSLGVLVLGLASLRVVWRALAPPPAAQGPAWQRHAAGGMHLVLIGLLLALPATGLADRWARGRAVSVFGGIALPAPFTVPGGRAWGEAHEVLAYVLLAAIGLHVAAALWHEFVLQDGLLSRMLGRGPGRALSPR